MVRTQAGGSGGGGGGGGGGASGGGAGAQDVPPQLLFIHHGCHNVKEVHFHPQLPGVAIATAESGFSVFKPSNADPVGTGEWETTAPAASSSASSAAP